MNLTDVIGISLGILGAATSIWFFYERIYPIRKLTWKSAEKTAERIAEQMTLDSFIPTLILGIGRGGAIMGALVSGCLGHRPLVVIDRKYTWKEGRRIDDIMIRISLPAGDMEKVLIIAGETHSGNTMRMYYDYFRNMGAKEVRRATFYYAKGSTEPVEYVGFVSSRDLLLPWMFTRRYSRESIHERTATTSHVTVEKNSNQDGTLGTCFVVRHGESADNATGDRYSGITDSQITERGIQQAEDVGRFLQKERIDIIYTSPMKRAVQTARVIQGKAGGQLMIDHRLREIDYGNWEGYTRQEIFERWPQLYNAYKEDPVKNHPPNAENPEVTLGRLLVFWTELQRNMAESVRNVVIVTHKSIGRLLLCHITGNPISHYRDLRLENCSISKIKISRSGQCIVDYQNMTEHISDKA